MNDPIDPSASGLATARETSPGPVPEPDVLPLHHRGATLPVSYLASTRADAAETLLYFHGLGGCKEDFAGAWDLPEWSDHTLVAVDAPGCGATGGYRRGVPLGVDDIVEVAAALVDHLDLDGLTVVGHSMGGLAGLLFATRHGDRVRRFVSVEGNLGPEDCSIYSRRVFREPFLGRAAEFMDALVTEMTGSGVTGYAEAAAVLRDNVADEAFFDYCRSIVAYSDGDPLLERFIGLDAATLYVHGSENAALTHIPRLEEAGVAVCAVPGSNHFPAASNRIPYFRILADFIAETTP